nr:hypothetical protein [Nakamurella lactea]
MALPTTDMATPIPIDAHGYVAVCPRARRTRAAATLTMTPASMMTGQIQVNPDGTLAAAATWRSAANDSKNAPVATARIANGIRNRTARPSGSSCASPRS